MVELGVAHANGAGVAKDDAQAHTLFERAANAGNPRGIANLAALSGSGGAPADPVKARAMLSKAAENKLCRSAVPARIDARERRRWTEGRYRRARSV